MRKPLTGSLSYTPEISKGIKNNEEAASSNNQTEDIEEVSHSIISQSRSIRSIEQSNWLSITPLSPLAQKREVSKIRKDTSTYHDDEKLKHVEKYDDDARSSTYRREPA